MQVKYTRHVDGEEEEEMLELDDQVNALRPFTDIEAVFVGQPDPNMALFQEQLKHMQANRKAGEKIDLSKIQSEMGKKEKKRTM